MKLHVLILSILFYGTFAAMIQKSNKPTTQNSQKLPTKAKSFTIPIGRSQADTKSISKAQRLKYLQSHLATVAAKYTTSHSTSQLSTSTTPIPLLSKLVKVIKSKFFNSNIKSRASTEQPLIQNYQNDYYYGMIQVGTPAVSFKVVVDTGSTDLILLSSGCSSGCKPDNRLYRPQDSSTSQDMNIPITTDYLAGTGIGRTFIDKVSLSTGGPSLVMEFEAVAQTVLDFDPGTSGIIGLGHLDPSQPGTLPFIQQLCVQGQLDAPLFSLALFRNTPDGSARSGGFLTVGGLDPTLYQGAIEYIPTIGLWAWVVSLGAIHLNGVDLGISSPSCTIDSGTVVIILPKKLAIAFYSTIPGSHEVGRGFFSYPCSYVKSVDIKFGSTRWNISLADQNLGTDPNDSSMCTGAVTYWDDNYCIIGEPLLRNVYTVFSFPPLSVGFAQLAGTKQQQGTLPSGTGLDANHGGNITASNYFNILITDMNQNKMGYLSNSFTNYGTFQNAPLLQDALVILRPNFANLGSPTNLISYKAVGRAGPYIGIAPGVLGIVKFQLSELASVVLTQTSGAGDSSTFNQATDWNERGTSQGMSKVWVIGNPDPVTGRYPLSLMFKPNLKVITCAKFFINKSDNPGAINAACSVQTADHSNTVLLWLVPMHTA